MTKRRPTPLRPNRGHVEDRKYKAFVREFHCIVCAGGELRRWSDSERRAFNQWGCTWYLAEAAHVGVRGLRQKCTDRERIPLCRSHNTQGRDSHHRMGRRFWEYHGLDRERLVAELQRRYAERQAA